jgi:hypothetical protein
MDEAARRAPGSARKFWMVVVVTITLVLLLPSVAQAKAKFNYRPWKCAMMGWYESYSTGEWNQQVALIDWTRYEKHTVAISTPFDFRYWRNGWDEKSEWFAMFITATEGQLPNLYLDKPLKAILRPFLGYNPESPGDKRTIVERR